MSYRKEIARQVSKATGIKQEIIKPIIRQSLNTIISILIADKKIELRNFGTFELKEVCSRRRYDIINKKIIVTKPVISITFKPSQSIKDKLNQDI